MSVDLNQLKQCVRKESCSMRKVHYIKRSRMSLYLGVVLKIFSLIKSTYRP